MDIEEILDSDGYEISKEDFKTYETYVESKVNVSKKLNIEVELFRGSKLPVTVMYVYFKTKMGNNLASLLMDVDEVCLRNLDDIWESFSETDITRYAFNIARAYMDSILEQEGAFTGNSAILRLSSEVDFEVEHE